MEIRVGKSYYNRNGTMLNCFAVATSSVEFNAGRVFKVREEMQKASTYWVDANGRHESYAGYNIVSEWGA